MAGIYGNSKEDRHYERMLDNYLDEQEETFECNVCGKPIDHEGICDSRICFEVDNE